MAIREDQLWDMSVVVKGENLPARSKSSHKQQLEKLQTLVAEWEDRIALAKPHGRQVLHLIEKFGGILPFAVACNRHPNHIIQLWLGVTKAGKVKPRDGLVPSPGILMRLIVVSRLYGVFLTPEDLFPDFMNGRYLRRPEESPDLLQWALAIEPGGGRTRESMQKLETQIANLLEG